MGSVKAVLLKNRKLSVEEIPEPVPGPGEALIEILKTGICSTDLELIEGYMDFEGVIGHEFVGRVVESRTEKLMGKRVVGEINLACGRCDFCRKGLPEHCLRRTVLGILGKQGAMAEFLALPEKNLHEIPDEITDAEAVFIEPLAAALEIVEQVEIQPDDRVLVLGDGKLGLLVAQVMKLKAEDVACLGKYERKLKILAEKGIATRFLGESLHEPYDLIVEATGRAAGISLALDNIRPRGKIVLKSTFHGEARLNVSKIVVDEISLVGSRCGPFSEALKVLEAKKVEVNDLVDGDFPLSRALEAFVEARKPGGIKILISP
jgi:threonine dehydrogenase-like Zn-dependent dehydrogenase